ncbi:MAG: hypothetical protein LBJ23_11385 [Tannerella sp.]|jgi:uncharacterized protein YndB with AHSA1/START domain|nr:hypothetical protein [Tannerella sp.]
MTKKEKFHIEYVFDKVSVRSLWNHLTTAMGLSSWFADAVNISGSRYTFVWNREQEEAELLEEKPEVKVRYRWLNEEYADYYFEFLIHSIELTGATSLEITDFAEPDEKADAIALWDSQVDVLKRTLGI